MKKIKQNRFKEEEELEKPSIMRGVFGYALITCICVAGISMLLPEIALAQGAPAKFDFNAGIAASTTPIITMLKEHWGKGVLVSGAGYALLGEGDLRQKAIKAAIGCGVSGGVVLGLIALLT